MKNINVLIVLFFMILFSACEKDFDETTVKTIDDDPTRVELSEVSGLVSTPNGEPIADAQVSISHLGNLYSLQTDLDGKYQIELPKDENPIYLLAAAANYVKSGIDKKVLNQNQVVNDFIISTADDMPYAPSDTPIILNDSLRVISGQLLYANGNPYAGQMVFLFNPVDLTNLFSVYEITDANGNFSFAYPPTPDIILAAFDECNRLVVISDDLDIEDEDIMLGTVTTSAIETETLVFSGFITDCNTGLGLVSGFVSVTIDGQLAANSQIINGEYSITKDNCTGSTCYDIKITTNLLEDATIELDCQPLDGTIGNKDYELCGDPVVNSSSDGEIKVLIGTDSLIIDNAIATEYSTFNYWEVAGFNVPRDLGVFFQINGNTTGNFPIQMFVPNQNGILHFYQPDSTLMTATVDVLDDFLLEGTLQGQVIEASTGLLLPMSGTFKIDL